ncbi:hypothetical protein [Streptomyces sp. NBC_00310]|uniref:hypothetical protein n=1 Tax=Streptomyces sp. NBC_00310 TaxID=2903645 RepID=UPI002E1B5FBE
MATMRRGLLPVLAWLLATGAAVTLTWWGVHTVMTGTAYDPPRALPITAADAQAQGAPAPITATALPEPTRSTKAPETDDSGEPSKSPSRSRQPSRSAKPSPGPSTSTGTGTGTPRDSGEIKGYDTEGGRVVLSLGADDATLVSATPGSGWSMQVWKTETWIRVDFAAGADRVSVFCTWHDSAPRVDVQNF